MKSKNTSVLSSRRGDAKLFIVRSLIPRGNHISCDATILLLAILQAMHMK